MKLTPELTGAIVALLAPAMPALATELAYCLKDLAEAEYNSKNRLPSGVTARAFRARCRHIPEATREGQVVRCPRAAWHASFAPGPDESGTLDAYEAACRRGVK